MSDVIIMSFLNLIHYILSIKLFTVRVEQRRHPREDRTLGSGRPDRTAHHEMHGDDGCPRSSFDPSSRDRDARAVVQTQQGPPAVGPSLTSSEYSDGLALRDPAAIRIISGVGFPRGLVRSGHRPGGEIIFSGPERSIKGKWFGGSSVIGPT